MSALAHLGKYCAVLQPSTIAASDLVTFPADQEFWINVDDDAYEPDFDGNFAKVYDSSCEPCMNYNPLEFMKYEAREEP